jgi:hypothetical protein
MRGPGYGVKDLIFYSGFIGGTIVTFLALQSTELSEFVRFLIGLPVGVALGWVLLKAYESRRPHP